LMEQLNNLVAPHPAFKDAKPIKTAGKPVLVDGVRMEHEYGWWLLRASNTGGNIIARYEADSEPNLKRIRTELENYLDLIELKI
jgi:phosphomannomutase